MWTVYNMDGTKLVDWPTKECALSSARSLKEDGRKTYVVNEKNAKIVWGFRHLNECN